MPSPLLFSPYALGDVVVRNRVWVSPMCQYAVLAEDGVPNDWHMVHLGSFSAGGAGLIMAESTAVSADGRISPRDTGLWNEQQQQAWARVVDVIHASGARAGVQLGHAGRKASTAPEWGSESRGTVPVSDGGWQTVAPSSIAYESLAPPRELDGPAIERVISDFGRAARRARLAGFDVVEVHAAHGYLLHQFLSPQSNHRDDDWGGSLENRARLLVAVVAAVHTEFGGPVMVRLSATDWVGREGWDLEETCAIVPWLSEAGAVMIDVSSGGNVRAEIPVGPGYQTRFSHEIMRRTGVATAAVGLITSAAQAESILVTGQAEVVLLGREHLRDPHTAVRFARELGLDGARLRELCAPPHRRGYP